MKISVNILFLLLLCLILPGCRSGEDNNEDRENPRLKLTTLDVDDDILDEQMLTTYWVTYGSHLRMDAVRFYEKSSTDVAYLPSYAAELAGRTEMIELYIEMAKGGYLVESLYLQELEMIYEAGYMKEYIYTKIETRDKPAEESMDLDPFYYWFMRTIPEHKVMTRVRIVYKRQEKS